MTEDTKFQELLSSNPNVEASAEIVKKLNELLEAAKSEVNSIVEIREQVESDHKIVISTVSLCKEVPSLRDSASLAKEAAEDKLEELRACTEEATTLFSKIDVFSSDAKQSVANLAGHVQVSEKADARVAQLEAELQKLKRSCELQLATI